VICGLLFQFVFLPGRCGDRHLALVYARQAADQKHDEETFAREQQAAPVPSPAPSPKAAKANNGAVVARLSIQRIHLRAMVREGSDDNTLDAARGLIPGTALPGQCSPLDSGGMSASLAIGTGYFAVWERSTGTTRFNYKRPFDAATIQLVPIEGSLPCK